MVYDTKRNVAVLFTGLSTWEWDGAEWRTVSTVGPGPRYNESMAYDKSRHVAVLFGGRRDGVGYLTDTWEWDGEAWTQVAAEGPPAGLYKLAFDTVRRVTVLFGLNYSRHPAVSSQRDVGVERRWLDTDGS